MRQQSIYKCFLLIALCLSAFASCTGKSKTHTSDSSADSIGIGAALLIPDTLQVVTLSGASTYFNYKDEDMGYEYELAKLFAESKGLELKVIVVPNATALLAALDSAKADLCITPRAVTQMGKQKHRFVGPEELSGLVLVQQKHKDKALLTDVTDLKGKQITVMQHTRAADRLHHLDDQIGGGIDSLIISGDTLLTEDLIAKISAGEIEYTIADEQLARLSRTYYPNIDVSMQVGFRQRLKWMTRKDNELLAKHIDEWTKEAPGKEEYRAITARYFESSKGSIFDQDASFNKPVRIKLSKGAISQYDSLFKAIAIETKLPWSWHILASIAYHESRFRHEIVAWSGARGLMGIMPRTGARFGADKAQLLDPEISIRVAAKCLIAFNKSYKHITDKEQQLKLTLAAYNAGPGHVGDAQRLAKKYGLNPDLWDGNVEEYIRLKNDPHYYNDPVSKCGYLRSGETLKYVRNVIANYSAYQSATR